MATACVLCYEALATSDRPTVAVIWGGVALAAFISASCAWLAAARALDRPRQVEDRAMDAALVCSGVRCSDDHLEPAPDDRRGQRDRGTKRTYSPVGRNRRNYRLDIGYLTGPGHVLVSAGDRAMTALQQEIHRRGPEPGDALDSVRDRAHGAPGHGTLDRAFGLRWECILIGQHSNWLSGHNWSFHPMCPACGCCRFAAGFPGKAKGAHITLLVLFLAEVGFGAAAAINKVFVVAVLAVIIPFSAARGRLPRVVLTGLIVTFMVVVIPFNQAYRNAVRQGAVTLTPAQGVATAPSLLVQTVTSGESVSVALGSLGYLMSESVRLTM